MDQRMGILVCTVEDDAALLASIGFSLEAEGYQARGFATAEALRASDLDPAVVDCFVIDQVLPEVTGIDLLRALRHDGVVAPIILITTNPSARIRDEAGTLGAIIVEKPLLGNALSRAIRTLLPERSRPTI